MAQAVRGWKPLLDDALITVTHQPWNNHGKTHLQRRGARRSRLAWVTIF